MISSIKMSRHSNTTISFSGADGVGKNTQIMLLKQYFENNGITYRILYARAGYNKVFFGTSMGQQQRSMLPYWQATLRSKR